MTRLGTITEIWRYPVSSLGGQLCRQAEIGPSGVMGDRQYALFDPVSNMAAAPEKDARWRPALFLSSSTCDDGTVICFPDGRRPDVGDPALLPMLSEHFGFHVAIGRYGDPKGQDSCLPQVKNRYDLAPLHMLTTASLDELAKLAPETTVHPRRFRPNLVIQTDGIRGFAETDWIEDVIGIGEIRIRVTEPTKRCGMTFIAQPSLDEQADILRNIVRANRRTLGVYGEVIGAGTIAVGNALHLQNKAVA